MSSIVIDGRKIAKNLIGRVADAVLLLKEQYLVTPKLLIVVVGDDESSKIYVKTKINQANKIGILTELVRFGDDCQKEEIVATIKRLNADSSVHGIIIQSPLPCGLSFKEISQVVDHTKDVDGFHVINAGKLDCNIGECFIPCTALGCLGLLFSVHNTLKGKHAIVVGRSNIVGRPLSSLLLNFDATVTVCHRATLNLPKIMRSGEIVITATGSARQFTKEYFAKGATVLDVGITRTENHIVGDVNFEDLLGHASHISPVPGGVGPMTVACLMMNVVRSACIATGSTSYKGLYDAFHM
jgi:methylenetetrahydrofolate dehydrogenase (NADP+)/methenyltetrahydrofolate cyclohydrolase